MSRRKAAPKRKILPDPKYKCDILAKFINTVMVSGKKSTAEYIVYGALKELARKLNLKEDDEGETSRAGKSGSEVLDAFYKALSNIKPAVEVRSRRVGGATYQIPVEVRGDRAQALAMRWIKDSAKKRSEKGMMLRLAGELVDAYHGRGAAIKIKEEKYRMAEANKAFAHYRI